MGELPFRGARNQHSHGERAGDAVAAVGHAENFEVTAPNGSTVAVAFPGPIWGREHGRPVAGTGKRGAFTIHCAPIRALATHGLRDVSWRSGPGAEIRDGGCLVALSFNRAPQPGR